MISTLHPTTCTDTIKKKQLQWHESHSTTDSQTATGATTQWGASHPTLKNRETKYVFGPLQLFTAVFFWLDSMRNFRGIPLVH